MVLYVECILDVNLCVLKKKLLNTLEKFQPKNIKIPKFYIIEYENFSKFYQTQINEKYLSGKCIIKNRDLKIPKFYSIEYENFSKFYQTQINEKYLSEKWIIKN